MKAEEAESSAVVRCDCYVHNKKFVGKIVEDAAARRSSLCPLLGIPAMVPPIKRGGNTEVKVLHRRVEDESLIEDMYKIGDVLGRGSFGIVYVANDVKTKEKLAIKQVNKEKAGSSAVTLLEREVSILKQVKHDHIIRLVEVFETAKKMFLVMELCELGDLKTILFGEGPFTEVSCRYIVKDLSDAIVYLHKHGIVHRDLKLDNILIAGCTQSPSEDPLYDIRLTDFGLSVVKGGVGSDSLLQSSCGTPVYMAPEVIKNHDYSEQCDQWSIGVILYAMLSRRFPFFADNEDRLFEAIKRAKLEFPAGEWDSISGSAKSLLKNLLVSDPAHRYTAREVATHPWTTGDTDQNASRPPNVLALMKNFAKMKNADDLDDTDDEFLGLQDENTSNQSHRTANAEEQRKSETTDTDRDLPSTGAEASKDPPFKKNLPTFSTSTASASSKSSSKPLHKHTLEPHKTKLDSPHHPRSKTVTNTTLRTLQHDTTARASVSRRGKGK